MLRQVFTAVVAALALRAPLAAQAPPPPSDPVVAAIREEGIARSRVLDLAQALMDSVGPRLTGTPGSTAASDWLVRSYRSWGIDARAESYGTWHGWRRGITHLDLIAPRVRTLEATMLAWSPGSRGPVTAPAVILPELRDEGERAAFLGAVKGKVVLVTAPQPSCRPQDSWQKWAAPESIELLQQARDSTRARWSRHARSFGVARIDELVQLLEGAGAAAFLSSEWSQGWGVQKVFGAYSKETAPHLDVACEDYGLLWRLAERGQGPIVRLEADAEPLGEVPVANTVAMIRGTALPEEYVLLSAHLDSWDGSSGATDNGTGTVAMMEAMRILRTVLPRPRRTIMVGHWNGEEQGLNGSRAFAADHPEIVAGLQALFNQDDGTGRIDRITMEGLVGPGAYFRDWLQEIPDELTAGVTLLDPGTPGRGGTDNASFTCAGAPAFGLNSRGWDYGTYTWHTNRDTFDKLVPDELRRNATLIALLAYFASEAPERLPRERVELAVDARTGQRPTWPACGQPQRSSGR
ncbi:MAG: M20/M25/M40 family metallo-hydrolase [Gemmatimonadetes bacterium]|nr:M20/M25/M40 family metallo-hydrolase [Gemmatimonadota bacterium]